MTIKKCHVTLTRCHMTRIHDTCTAQRGTHKGKHMAPLAPFQPTHIVTLKDDAIPCQLQDGLFYTKSEWEGGFINTREAVDSRPRGAWARSVWTCTFVEIDQNKPQPGLFNVWEYSDPNDPDCAKLNFRQWFVDVHEAHLYGEQMCKGAYQVQDGLFGEVYNPGVLPKGSY